MTGISLAGGAGFGNANLANVYAADTERALADNWQIQGPIETGALPNASGGASGNSGIVSGGDAACTFAEIGGVKYRVGLDAGP